MFKEARTRILLVYALSLMVLTTAAIPVFKYLLFGEINRRVRADLRSAKMQFTGSYKDWESVPEQTTEDLEAFLDDHLDNHITEDENYHIAIIDDQLYDASPRGLPAPIAPGSQLFRDWTTVREFSADELPTEDPKIGSILYKATPLTLENDIRGAYVIVHLTAGERREALAGVRLFVRMLFVINLLSLLLSWISAGQLMAPLASLSKTARSIREANLSQRIPPVSGNSELSELAETFNAMMNRIQHAFDSQRSFVNDAGHELLTPITIIRGHLELLNNEIVENNPEERQATLIIVIDELDRMSRLVNDMLLLTKSERVDFLQLETIDVSEFVGTLFSKAKTLASRNWLLNLENCGKMVGDRQRLTGALLNLLRNATQHTQTTDTIELGCCLLNNNTVKLWVRDTGVGISQPDQQRIFSRFARGKQPQRSEGAGLGLAIVTAIAEAHKGSVNLVSQPGKGATFSLILPMDPPSVHFSMDPLTVLL